MVDPRVLTDTERTALTSLRFNWAPVPDDVWRASPFHVEGLHPHIEQTVLQGLEDAAASADASPIGLVLQGQRGAGKTHLLGWTREQVHAQGGYFFLVSLLDAKGFWDSLLGSLSEGLFRPIDGRYTQLHLLLRRLGTTVGAPRFVRRAVCGETPLTRTALDAFVEHLRAAHDLVARECQDTLRALALLAADDAAVREIGETYLQSGDDDFGERPQWGMRRGARPAELIVRDVSWLLALTGPTVIAVDQIDTLIAQSVKTLRGAGEDDPEQDAMLEQIAGGLMKLRERTRRTLTLVACLPSSWMLIKQRATDTVQDRFREATQLKTIPSAQIGEAIVARRFAWQYAKVGFAPPYPTWPVASDAFADVPGFTPRELLIQIDKHVQSCVSDGGARELYRLGEPSPAEPPASPAPVGATRQDLSNLDRRFAEAKAAADIESPLRAETEDSTIPSLLAAGLTAWMVEQSDGLEYDQDPPPSTNPALHARLRRVLDAATEDQVHWAFRAIAATHPVAALNRLRKASTAAGLAEGVAKRKLVVLRNGSWSRGPKTHAALNAFTAAGGVVLPIGEDDLRGLAALQTLFAEDPPQLQAWLTARRPASTLGIFRAALTDGPDGVRPAEPSPAAGRPTAVPGLVPERAPAPVPRPRSAAAQPKPAANGGAEVPATAITVGRRPEDDKEVRVDVEALRKHVAIFAGSGSGKTVLIRRLVEECALRGVSAIVLDPNNDLSRLGDPWPEPPAAWRDGDAARAADYLANTDVAIWTPRRESGRPLSFQPLPDFRSVADNADEFTEAVEVAVAAIAPRAKLAGPTTKAQLGLAVLRTAVRHYGRRGGGSLKGLIDLLSAMPDGICDLDNAERIGADLAQTLTAAMVNDPLFGGGGTAVDPGVLLTPPPGKRARVSVISFVGLHSDDQRQSFVNQLQMALFAWIKKHPAGDRPLGGLFVMDEAQTLAPSGAMTACTASTLALASQARKYGLGLVFATQAPKGLHNQIPGNAATQFFGLLNAPIQIAAAKDMAAAKGGQVPDVSRLRSGEFYVAVEGAGFDKVRTPLCLSYHPKSPLTLEEVVERARSGAPAPTASVQPGPISPAEPAADRTGVSARPSARR